MEDYLLRYTSFQLVEDPVIVPSTLEFLFLLFLFFNCFLSFVLSEVVPSTHIRLDCCLPSAK
jgi:hypothetical protein